MIEIVEMLRLWLQGLGLREVARVVGCFNWALTGRLTSSDCSKGHQMMYGRGMVVLWWRVSHDNDLSLR